MSRYPAVRVRTFMSIAAIAIFVALTVPVHASVHYTPVNIVIHNNGSYSVDFNHDGAKDLDIGSSLFAMRCRRNPYAYRTVGSVIETPANPSTGVVTAGGYPAALPAGVSLSSQTFIKGQGIMTHFVVDCRTPQVVGNWFNVTRRFLAVQFQIDGQTHYGWVELSTNAVLQIFSPYSTLTTTVIGFAYETVPGEPILTGDTGNGGSCGTPDTDQTIKICSPPARSTEASPVAINAHARWDFQTISHMRIYIDNNDVFDQDNPPNDAISTSIFLNPGSHNLVIIAWNTHGNYIQNSETFNSR